ncbi:hypothetical protein [Chryseobacterium kwangjuense]|uniref:Carboxypeptidase regulatory-like domain-containing protein n=1 Tax=Chryseobacterium kwangjuense TaxID=267125 RepID=A0A135WHJ0_9FLAO|nr:hypothetical protein [Chryseobacterium kwangjuense]KXH84345.1 hypothetical protein AU378_00875 [Chryseobacterium kwangjuense]
MDTYPKSHLFVILLLLGSFSIAKAQRKVEYVLPTAVFDKQEAYKMLEEGKYSIQGRISLKKRGYVNYPDFRGKVLLYPVTPHLLEYIELKKKYNSKKKQAAMTREAALTRIESRTLDSDGNFIIKYLKPGKYYIVSWVTWEKVTSSQVQSGSVNANYNMLGQQMGGGYVPTTTQYDATAYEREIGEFVEVTGDTKVNIAR